MSEPTDRLARALQAYAVANNLPPDATYVLYSPNCMVPAAELTRIAKSAGSVAVAIRGVPDDEIWFTDAGLNHARKTKISKPGG